jgi:hypothetical protein
MSKDGSHVNYNNDEINKFLVIFLLEKLNQLNYSKRQNKTECCDTILTPI